MKTVLLAMLGTVLGAIVAYRAALTQPRLPKELWPSSQA